tara:strand:- start:4055 stop:4210 length:156 start_codon:yes stop_codon:yes gene_type:complete
MRLAVELYDEVIGHLVGDARTNRSLSERSETKRPASERRDRPAGPASESRA